MPADQLSPAAKTAPAQALRHPVVESIRAKLADADFRQGGNVDDLAALETFYARRTGGPLWMTEMGFSARGQRALFEIEKANDWGLDAAAFELPPAGDLPEGPEAEAIAEIKLNLAILKYARFARGGRFSPSEISGKIDQAPVLRNPKMVLAEIEAAHAPELLPSVPAPKARTVHPPAPGAPESPRQKRGECQTCEQRDGHQKTDHQHGALALDA